MKIRTKLKLGIGLLLCLIVGLSVISIMALDNLKKDTHNILIANYNTLEYSKNMIDFLDDIPEDRHAVQSFNDNLQKQMSNVTENGENELTSDIYSKFTVLQAYPYNQKIKVSIRKDILGLMQLNMKAIKQKSELADETAERMSLVIAFTCLISFLIALFLFLRFPSYIVRPIQKLTESIRQIANENYSQRLHFKTHTEYADLSMSFNIMAEKLEAYSNSRLDKILMEKRRLEILINNMHDPVIGLDENKKILFVNDEALKITGLNGDNIRHKSIIDLSVSNDLIRKLIVELVNPEEKTDKSPLKIFFDNKESYFEKEIIHIEMPPVEDHPSRLIGYVIILKNITPFKELDSAKSNFIATISHELKTPISSISMSTQLLEHKATGNLNEEQQQLVESIKDDSGRLLKITEELLKMSQVETGNIQLNIQSVHPDIIVKYALDTVRSQAEQKHLEIVQEIGEDIPDINVDAEKTAWVLTNFLTNAIRYSLNGNEVELSLQEENSEVIFAVKDHGKGIEERYKNKIFEKYFQIPGSSKSGSGLGLAISKEFIETQGGTIGVESEPGMGSTFYFKFPFTKKSS